MSLPLLLCRRAGSAPDSRTDAPISLEYQRQPEIRTWLDPQLPVQQRPKFLIRPPGIGDIAKGDVGADKGKPGALAKWVEFHSAQRHLDGLKILPGRQLKATQAFEGTKHPVAQPFALQQHPFVAPAR